MLFMSEDERLAVADAVALRIVAIEEGGAICVDQALQLQNDQKALQCVLERLGGRGYPEPREILF